MTLTVNQIASAIEEFAPLSVQEGWDNSGLLIGSPDAAVKGVLLGLDCTADLIDEAVEKGAGMVVTHHPLIFGGIKRICPEDPVGLAVMKAISGSVAVYAAHTNADKVISGVSWNMASKIGLANVQCLCPDSEGRGLGVVGDLPEPLAPADFAAFVKDCFSLKLIRSSVPIDHNVKRVALCGGSGASLAEDAIRAGADALVTADVSYHKFFTPNGFMLMDIGHFESEVGIVEVFYSELRKKFPNFAVRVSDKLREANPVHYF